MTNAKGMAYGWLAVWLVLVWATLLWRQLIPIDETRYLTVAWEMWLRGDFLVPHLNGQPYSHKPPLIFWLYQLGWTLFGVNAWWPRLLQPLFALLSGVFIGLLARQLWPDYRTVATLAPWLLIGCMVWAFFLPFVMFDMALVFLVLVGLWGLLLVNEGRSLAGWLLFTLATALGILAKGPVVLLHLIFPALLVPWWATNAASRTLLGWYGGLGLAIVAAVALALAWAVPAASSGGHDYEQAILWHQTVDRLGQAAPHRQSWWWYLAILPIFLLPWSLCFPMWKAIRNLRLSQDSGLRFCLAWIIPTFLAFSILPTKQPHYLLPLLPGCILVAARSMEQYDSVDSRWAFTPVSALIVVSGMAFLLLPQTHLLRLPDWAYTIHSYWGIALIMLGVFLALQHWHNMRDAVIPITLGFIMALLLIEKAIFTAARPGYNIENAAQILSRLEKQGEALVNTEKYHGQFHFLGRLTKPFSEIREQDICIWLKNNAHGYVVNYTKNKPSAQGPSPIYIQPYRNRSWLSIWDAKTLCEKVSKQND